MNTVRLIVVGCGYFGLKRIQACLQIPTHVSLVAVVDKNIKLAEKIANKYHVFYGNSIVEVTKKFSCDAAIIAVPNMYHKECSLDALSCGLHVLCEKPLASTHKDAIEIEKAAIKYNRLLKTGSNHRYFSSVQKAYEVFKKGTIGNILLFRGSIGNNGTHVQDTWFWDKQKSGGGTFIDNGCHLVDIARWFMGDFISSVGTMTNVYWKKTDVEDVGTAIFMTKKNQLAVITCSWTQWAGYIAIEIWGDKGFIIIDSKDGDTIVVGNRTNTKTRRYTFATQKLNSYQKELIYFASCIRNNVQPSPNGTDGKAVLRLIECAYESAQKKKEIRI